MNTEQKPNINIDTMIAEERVRSERRRLLLQELLQAELDKKGYFLVHSSAMGKVASPLCGNSQVCGWALRQ